MHHDRWQTRISIGTIDLVSTMNPPLRRRNGRDDDCDDGGGDDESLSWWMPMQHPRVQDPPGLHDQRMTCVTGTVVVSDLRKRVAFFLFFFEFVLGGISAEKMKKLFSGLSGQ